MANDTAALHAEAHPAPHRNRVPLGWQFFGLLAAPSAWALHLLINYGLTSGACFPGNVPRLVPLPNLQWVWPAIIAIDVIALLIAAAGLFVSYRNWRASRDESSGRAHELVETGEGRTRFLSVWGLLISGLFLLAIALDLVGALTLSLCA